MDSTGGGDLKGLRVGVPRNHYFDRVSPEVEEAVRQAIERLAELGAKLVDVEIPMARYVQAIQWGLMVPEATAYHERSLRDVSDLYTPGVRILLEAGELTSAGDYLRAQRARTMMRDDWARMFDGIDVLAAPTAPMTAVKSGQDTVEWADGTVEAVSDSYVRLSAPANITGVPALTLPVGHDHAGLPIGMQLMARPFRDATVLRVGRVYEEAATDVGRIAPVRPEDRRKPPVARALPRVRGRPCRPPTSDDAVPGVAAASPRAPVAESGTGAARSNLFALRWNA